jgi:four helix bundle protein
MEITSYRDLKVWQAAMSLAERVYSASGDFPKSEVYGLAAQVRRAAVSIAANIAEGHGRETSGAFVQFLRVAQGSLKEVETHLILSHRLGFVAEKAAHAVLDQCDELGRMLRALIRVLQEKAQSDY